MMGHADRRHMYSILLTPSLFSVLLSEPNSLFICFDIWWVSSVFERLDLTVRQLEMIDSLFGDRFVQPFSTLFLRMGADRRADAEALGWLAGDHT